MAWTAPTTRATGNLITASIWNTDIIDNLRSLADLDSEEYSENSNYSTSSTSYVDIDSTNLDHSITLDKEGDVLVGLTGTFAIGSTAFLYLKLTQNNTQVLEHYRVFANQTHQVSILYLAKGFVAATYTFGVEWRVSSGTVTMYGNNYQFFARAL